MNDLQSVNADDLDDWLDGNVDFETAWQRYMFDIEKESQHAPVLEATTNSAAHEPQSLNTLGTAINPNTSPQKYGQSGLLNSEESNAFNLFLDSLIMEPTSPAKNSNRIDLELQKLNAFLKVKELDIPNDRSVDEHPQKPEHRQPYETQQLPVEPKLYSFNHGINHSRNHNQYQMYNTNAPVYPEMLQFKYQKPAIQPQSVLLPSVQQPSVQQPSVQQPSVQLPSVQLPPVQAPPVQAPPVQAPQVQAPQVQAQFHGYHQSDPLRARPHPNVPQIQLTDPPVLKRASERTQSNSQQVRIKHLNSEKKRRALISESYSTMCSLLPQDLHKLLSKSTVLKNTYIYLLDIKEQNKKMREKLASLNIDCSGIPSVELDPVPWEMIKHMEHE